METEATITEEVETPAPRQDSAILPASQKTSDKDHTTFPPAVQMERFLQGLSNTSPITAATEGAQTNGQTCQ